MRGAHTRALARNDASFRTAEAVSPDQAVLLLSRLPAVRGDEERGLKRLTPAQVIVLQHLVAAIRVRGGKYVRCYGEIAAELNVARRTVIRASLELQARGLVLHRTGTTRRGGDAASVWRLGQWLGRLLLSPDRNVTPKPVRVKDENLEVSARGLESGGAARPDHFVSALRAAFEPRALGSACRQVVGFLARTCPERWRQDALRLAGHTATAAGASIEAPGAFVRQRLADLMRAHREEPPREWRVKSTPTAELVRLRELHGLPQKVRRVVEPEGGRPGHVEVLVPIEGATWWTPAGPAPIRARPSPAPPPPNRTVPDPQVSSSTDSPPRTGGFSRPDADWRRYLGPHGGKS